MVMVGAVHVCAACVGSSLSQSKTRKVGVCCSWLPHLIHAFDPVWRGGGEHNMEKQNTIEKEMKIKM